MVPSLPTQECPNFSETQNPLKDWPAISSVDQEYWSFHRRQLSYCRAKELMARETLKPGSQKESQLEISWMILESVKHSEEKIAAIYEANKKYKVPPLILTGALQQESLLAELSVSRDGGNYSCGIGQVNIREWCHWANNQSAETKRNMKWPAKEVPCESKNLVNPGIIKPFYDIAISRLQGQPEYKLQKSHFDDIPLKKIKNQLPRASDTTQKQRYIIARSFLENCSSLQNGIMAKANELSLLYHYFVPKGLKDQDRYKDGDAFKRICKEKPADNAFPLHTGWLMAVSAYNAGPMIVDAVAHYQDWDRTAIAHTSTWNEFHADQLISSLYWTGKYNRQTDMIEFNGLDGKPKKWSWNKACIGQRHIARVVQHVTYRPDFFVDSLEGDTQCAESIFINGLLMKSGVPPRRQASEGIRIRATVETATPPDITANAAH